MAKPICRLTSQDASVTFVPANGEGPCVDLSVSGGGGIGGGGTATEVAFFTAAATIGSDPQFFWNNVAKNLLVGDPLTGPLTGRISINTPITAAAAFLIQKTTAPDDFFAVTSSTGAAGTLAPLFFGHRNASTVDPSLWFLGTLAPAADAVGAEAVVWFMARVGNSSGGGAGTVINAPLFKWFNNSVEFMRMRPNGYLGVGQTSPVARVHASNSSGVDPGLIVDGGSVFGLGPIALFRRTAAGTVVLGVQATSATGRVGIGTVASAPTELLDVAGGKSKFDNGANATWNVSILAADPAAPVNGDCWFTDIAGVRRWNVRIAGVSYSVVMV